MEHDKLINDLKSSLTNSMDFVKSKLNHAINVDLKKLFGEDHDSVKKDLVKYAEFINAGKYNEAAALLNKMTSQYDKSKENGV